jgi:ABC-type multidrug transport system ATPase subunit
LSFKAELRNTGRRYNREWIFRGITHTLQQGSSYVILGPNGSGKSTLLQLIAGAIMPSEGSVDYSYEGSPVSPDHVFRHISIASPYLELVEEFTFSEIIDFQSGFKPFLPGLRKEDIVRLSGLGKSLDKPIRYYSSGMKQRARLTLALLADSPVLLLDEPVSNLDKASVGWYRELAAAYTANRLCIVCSNQQEEEFFFCTRRIDIQEYK